MKGKKSLLIACVCVALLSIGSTTAYFTYRQELRNQVAVGTNVIEVDEEYEPPRELTVGENIFKKVVRVKNTGTIPCYVRVYADFSDSTIKDLASLTENGRDWFPANDYYDHLPDGWVYITKEEDPLLGNYFYWTEPIDPKKSTGSLFEKVKVTFENADQIKDFEIIVYGESVQTLDIVGAEFTGADPWRQAWTEFLERR